MKTELTSLDLFYLVRELKALESARVEKIYEQEDDKKEFIFIFHKTGPGRQNLRIKLPGLVYISETKPEFPETPPGFCTFLRKYLMKTRVIEVRQKGFERILEIVLETKETKLTLVCEMFSKGNMLLLDENGKIKGLLESQNWESRTIRGGTKYEYPPEQVNTPKLGMKEYEKIITGTAFDQIVKTFAIELGLGGFYAEELCRRSGIPKEKKRLSVDDMNKSFIELGKMLHEEIKANLSGGEILPFETGGKADKTFESFNKALDETLTPKITTFKEVKQEKEKQTKDKKLKNVLDKQEERLKELEESVVNNQRKGELIYEHYQEIKELLDNINADRKKMTWDELKKKYPNVKIDEKKGTVIVDF